MGGASWRDMAPAGAPSRLRIPNLAARSMWYSMRETAYIRGFASVERSDGLYDDS